MPLHPGDALQNENERKTPEARRSSLEREEEERTGPEGCVGFGMLPRGLGEIRDG